MKRLYLPAIVASAAALLLVVSASSAYAVQVFLLNGGKIEKSINVTVTGELLLEDMNAPGTPDILCSTILDGTLESGKKGIVSEMLTLGGVGGNLVECTDDKSTCSTPVDVTASNLPWILVSDFSDPEKKEGNEPRLTVDCNSILGLVEDTCTGPIGGKAENVEGGVLVVISEAFLVPAMTCTVGGAAEGLVEGSLLTSAGSGGTLTVSTE